MCTNARCHDRTTRRTAIGALALALVLAARPAGAQVEVRWVDVTAGSRWEHTLIDRCALAAGLPIGVRPFGARILDSLATACGIQRPTDHLERAPVRASLSFNSTRAPVETDEGVWRGRGLTIAASGGVRARWRFLSASLRPLAFLSQNLSYAPSRSVAVAPGDFGSPWSDFIDAPYRFGPGAYGRIVPGETFLRADFQPVAFGFSTATQVWGPARIQPLVLGSSAGGFPHAFIETGTPLNVGIGRVVARWIGGSLASSAFRPSPGNPDRLAVGAVGAFAPRGLAGLEIGASRFFHIYDEAGARSVGTATLPFGGLLRSQLSLGAGTPDATNQLASIFARIAPVGSFLEAYGEFYREDHAVDLRDLLVEPDHNSAFMLGFRARSEDAGRTLTVEASNGRMTHIARLRSQSSSHTHGVITEGHTVRGLPLASPALAGGGGLNIQWDSRDSTRAWAVSAATTRRAHDAEGGGWNGEQSGYHTIAAAQSRRRGGTWYTVEARIQPGFGDIPGTNLSLSVSLTR